MSSALTSARTRQRRSISSLSASAASLSHTVSSIDSSKPAAVIELGSRLTKCGFAGQYVPRIIRTSFLDEHLCPQTGFLDRDGGPTINSLLHFFKYIFHNILVTIPRERRVVIVESVFCPTDVRKNICKVLLEMLHVPSVLFIPSHLAATFPFNTDNALVVDVGTVEALAIPVAQGVTMVNNWGTSSVGTNCLEERISMLLKEHGRIEDINGEQRPIGENEWERVEKYGIVEDIAVRYVFVSSMERGRRIQNEGETVSLEPAAGSVRIPFGVETLIVPGCVREGACEVFFEDRSVDAPSLPKMLLATIAKCPLDLRRMLSEGLLMMGGPTLIPGFLARIKEEMLAEASRSQLKFAQSVKFFRFKEQHAEIYLGWLGGSMFGALQEAVQRRSLNRDEFLEKGYIPDWTDYVQYNIPNGKGTPA